jgi:hypothetical protein
MNNLNYKRWAITQRIKELEKAIKRSSTPAREEELERLKKELES